MMSEEQKPVTGTGSTTDSASGDRPLRGIRVIDLMFGPMAAIARHYAELGADVVRLEPAAGADDRSTGTSAGGISLEFVATNLGKRAGTLALLPDLAKEADILIAPAAALDVAALRAQNRALVVMYVSDFGATGAFGSWRGSGPVFHALSGELSRSGIPGRQPLLPPGDLAIASAAAQAAYVALLAYWQALKTGEGDHLDFSVLDGSVQALFVSGRRSHGTLFDISCRRRHRIDTCGSGLCAATTRGYKGKV